MAAINLQAMDDFMAVNIAKYERVRWQDISMQLQEYFYAQKLFGKGEPDEMNSSQVVWDVQYDYDDNFAVTAPFDPDVSSRKDTMTQAKMFWSFMKSNYQYDYREEIFNMKPEAIVRWIDVKEHGLDNSFFTGMEKLMFGPGPTSPTQSKPPPASLQWWLPAYNTAANFPNNNTALQFATGVTSDFLGGDPPGFSSVGTGNISSLQYPGWRHRVGVYTAFTEDDAIDTILECMEKCSFMPAKSYPQLSEEVNPRWDMLTTYSRLKLARKIAQSRERQPARRVGQVEGRCPHSWRSAPLGASLDEPDVRHGPFGRPGHGSRLEGRQGLEQVQPEHGQEPARAATRTTTWDVGGSSTTRPRSPSARAARASS